MIDQAEMERTVLGRLFLDQGTGHALLEPEDFSGIHRDVYRVLVRLHREQGTAWSLPQWSAALETDRVPLRPVDWADMLERGALMRGELKHYATMLRRQRVLREIRERALHIAERAQPHADPQQLADEAIQRFRDLPTLADRDSLSGLHSVGEIMAMEQITGPEAEVATGLPDLDRHARIHAGTLTFIGARPGCGKSALMLDWSVSAATRCGFQVLFFSLEMTLKDLRARLWTMFPYGASEVANVPVWIQEPFQQRPPVGHLVAMAAEFCRVLRDRPTLVVVDYLQIIAPNRYWQTRREAVGEVVRELKAMSMALEVPVIAGAQLSRAFEQRGPKAKPQLSDLKESGEAEEAGDLVLLLHRPSKASEDPELRVAKNRHGPGGYTVPLVFDQSTARFHQRAFEDS